MTEPELLQQGVKNAIALLKAYEALAQLNAVDLVFWSSWDWRKQAYSKTEVFPVLNTNDTFAYATADGESIEMDEAEDLLAIWRLHSHEGMIAWASVKRGKLPIQPLLTDKFMTALREVSSFLNGKENPRYDKWINKFKQELEKILMS